MSEKETVKEILRQALDADENGDKENAVELYTKAVEIILKISDPTLRERLNKYAVQALDRAEELRGISSPKRTTQTTNVDETSASHRVQSNCKIVWFACFSFHVYWREKIKMLFFFCSSYKYREYRQ